MSKHFNTAKEMLEIKSNKNLKSGCIEWLGYLNSQGYGHIPDYYWARYYKITKAHQLSYIIYKGDYNRKLCICHRCNNSTCINPRHLYAGTHKDNMRDMVRAKRFNNHKGSKNSQAKLTEQEVYEIRDLCTVLKYIDIAPLYNISDTLVRYIHKRQIWKHI